jgi:pimeloyl-ACP methyl ester carboxylesterase
VEGFREPCRILPGRPLAFLNEHAVHLRAAQCPDDIGRPGQIEPGAQAPCLGQGTGDCFAVRPAAGRAAAQQVGQARLSGRGLPGCLDNRPRPGVDRLHQCGEPAQDRYRVGIGLHLLPLQLVGQRPTLAGAGHRGSNDLGQQLLLAAEHREDRRCGDARVGGDLSDGGTGVPPGAKRPLRVELSGLTTPTLFLWGDHDSFGPASLAQEMADLMPSARAVTVPGVGHLIWLDQPERTLALVTGFLTESSSEPARAATDPRGRSADR